MGKFIITKCDDCSTQSNGLCFPICFPACFTGTHVLLGKLYNKTKQLMKAKNKQKQFITGENK